jgi:hypothetical protein
MTANAALRAFNSAICMLDEYAPLSVSSSKDTNLDISSFFSGVPVVIRIVPISVSSIISYPHKRILLTPAEIST